MFGVDFRSVRKLIVINRNNRKTILKKERRNETEIYCWQCALKLNQYANSIKTSFNDWTFNQYGTIYVCIVYPSINTQIKFKFIPLKNYLNEIKMCATNRVEVCSHWWQTVREIARERERDRFGFNVTIMIIITTHYYRHCSPFLFSRSWQRMKRYFNLTVEYEINDTTTKLTSNSSSYLL